MTIRDAVEIIREFGTDGETHTLSFDLDAYGYSIPLIIEFGGPDRQLRVDAKTRRSLPAEHTLTTLFALQGTFQQTHFASAYLHPGTQRWGALSGTTVEDVLSSDDKLAWVMEQTVKRLLVCVRQIEFIVGGAIDVIPFDDELLAMNLRLKHFPAFASAPDDYR